MIFAFLFIFVNEKTLWPIYILAFLLQSLNDIDMSSETAILPELVSKDQLQYSNSVFSFLESTSVFLAPAIGGIIYNFYGSNMLFIINAISFLIAGILFSFIKYNHVRSEINREKIGIIKSGLDGYKTLSKYVNVKIVFVIMSVFAVLGRFYETYKVAVSDILLGLNPEGIIYFDYALAIGGLSVPLIVKALSKRNHVIIFTISSIIVNLAYLIFGYSHNFIITFIILAILGLTQSIQGIYKILLTLFAILGLLIASPLYALVGIGNSFLIVAAISIVLCLIQLKYRIS